MNDELHLRDETRDEAYVERVRIVVRCDDSVVEAIDADGADHEEAIAYAHVHACVDLIVRGTRQVITSPGTWRVDWDTEIRSNSRRVPRLVSSRRFFSRLASLSNRRSSPSFGTSRSDRDAEVYRRIAFRKPRSLSAWNRATSAAASLGCSRRMPASIFAPALPP